MKLSNFFFKGITKKKVNGAPRGRTDDPTGWTATSWRIGVGRPNSAAINQMDSDHYNIFHYHPIICHQKLKSSLFAQLRLLIFFEQCQYICAIFYFFFMGFFFFTVVFKKRSFFDLSCCRFSSLGIFFQSPYFCCDLLCRISFLELRKWWREHANLKHLRSAVDAPVLADDERLGPRIVDAVDGPRHADVRVAHGAPAHKHPTGTSGSIQNPNSGSSKTLTYHPHPSDVRKRSSKFRIQGKKLEISLSKYNIIVTDQI